jgi:hypothetical protein
LAYQTLKGEMCQEVIAKGYEDYPSKVYFYKIVLSAIDYE